jgi:hypothetical protein
LNYIQLILYIYTVLNVLKLTLIIINTPITYVLLTHTLGSIGNNNLNIPYKLNFYIITTNNILLPNGDSIWAFNNQLFKN